VCPDWAMQLLCQNGGIAGLVAAYVLVCFEVGQLYGFTVDLSVHRIMAVAVTGFLDLFLIDSVHWAPLYAIDGYVSIMAVFFVWRACGWLVRSHAKGSLRLGVGAFQRRQVRVEQ
jgi:hypothetical protein